MKHPLSVMIWGCIFRKGVGTIQVLEENRPIHSSRYIKEVQMRLSAPDLFGAIVATSHFSGMEHHATQVVSISDGSSNTMSNCWLGPETVHTSTLLRICGHDWRVWWCRSYRATRPALLKQSSARGSELLLLPSWRKLWTRCLELEGVRLSSIQGAIERHSRLSCKQCLRTWHSSHIYMSLYNWWT